jgi:hypothetical protein
MDWMKMAQGWAHQFANDRESRRRPDDRDKDRGKRNPKDKAFPADEKKFSETKQYPDVYVLKPPDKLAQDCFFWTKGKKCPKGSQCNYQHEPKNMKTGHCWVCGGPHFKMSCAWLKGYKTFMDSKGVGETRKPTTGADPARSRPKPTGRGRPPRAPPKAGESKGGLSGGPNAEKYKKKREEKKVEGEKSKKTPPRGSGNADKEVETVTRAEYKQLMEKFSRLKQVEKSKEAAPNPAPGWEQKNKSKKGKRSEDAPVVSDNSD